MRFEPVVGCGEEIGFPVAEQRKVNLGGADLLIPGQAAELLRLIGKGNVLLKEVDFRDDAEEDIDGDVQFRFDPD